MVAGPPPAAVRIFIVVLAILVAAAGGALAATATGHHVVAESTTTTAPPRPTTTTGKGPDYEAHPAEANADLQAVLTGCASVDTLTQEAQGGTIVGVATGTGSALANVEAMTSAGYPDFQRVATDARDIANVWSQFLNGGTTANVLSFLGDLKNDCAYFGDPTG